MKDIKCEIIKILRNAMVTSITTPNVATLLKENDEIAEDIVKLLATPDVSVAKHPLPRPLECWNKARELDCGDYIEWHLEKERGNAR